MTEKNMQYVLSGLHMIIHNKYLVAKIPSLDVSAQPHSHLILFFTTVQMHSLKIMFLITPLYTPYFCLNNNNTFSLVSSHRGNWEPKQPCHWSIINNCRRLQSSSWSQNCNCSRHNSGHTVNTVVP